MKKKEYFIMIMMAVFTLAIVSLIIFTITKRVSDETKKEKSNTVQEEKVISGKLTVDEQSKLMQLINVYDAYLISFDGKKNIKDLTDEEKITFVAQLPFLVQKEWGLDFEVGVTLDKIIEILEYYFGPNIRFQPVNYNCFLGDGDYLIYDPKTKMYYADTTLHGHEAYIPYQVYSFYIDGSKQIKDGLATYQISVKKAFAAPNATSYYGSYTDAKNKTNMIVDMFALYGEKVYTSIEDLIKIQYEKHKGLFETYTYEFQVSDSLEKPYLIKLENGR